MLSWWLGRHPQPFRMERIRLSSAELSPALRVGISRVGPALGHGHGQQLVHFARTASYSATWGLELPDPIQQVVTDRPHGPGAGSGPA